MDKVTDFFEKLGTELQHQQDWKEWFGKHTSKENCLFRSL